MKDLRKICVDLYKDIYLIVLVSLFNIIVTKPILLQLSKAVLVSNWWDFLKVTSLPSQNNQKLILASKNKTSFVYSRQ